MECKDRQSQFSAYIDEELTEEERKLLDDHLKACQHCRHALEELRKAVALTKGLDELEPPPWLSERVMAGIRQEAEKKGGIMGKLFFPLHIKLPLEIFATLAIIVTAFYVFRTVGPEVQAPDAPPAEYRAPAEKREGVAPAEPPAPARTDTFEKESGRFEKARERAAETEPAGTAFELADSKERTAHFSVRTDNRVQGIEALKQTIESLEGRIIGTVSLGDRTIISAELEGKKLKSLSERLDLLGKADKKESFQEGRQGKTLVTIEVME